jgi:hypothetical protein
MSVDGSLASTDAEIDACEDVIREGFGRVMRLGVDSEADERRALKTLYCRDSESGKIMATSRLVPLDYLEKSQALIDEYRIGVIPADLRRRSLLSFQSAAVSGRRGSDVMPRLFQACFEYGLNGGYLLIVSACKPYLFAHFTSMGFRPYEQAYISSEGGYRIPIVLVNHDRDYLRACGSPFASALSSTPDAPELLAGKVWFEKTRPADKDINVKVLTRPEQVNVDLRFFRGLSEQSIRSIFRYAVEIACKRGDQIIKETAAEYVIGFVLDGNVDVFKGNKKLTTLKAGDIFGEVSFLLKVPRTASLVAASDDARIAFISVHNIDAIKDPSEAALFWRNLSGYLAGRLQNITELL